MLQTEQEAHKKCKTSVFFFFYSNNVFKNIRYKYFTHMIYLNLFVLFFIFEQYQSYNNNELNRKNTSCEMMMTDQHYPVRLLTSIISKLKMMRGSETNNATINLSSTINAYGESIDRLLREQK